MKAYELTIFMVFFDMTVVILLCFTDLSTVFTFISSFSNFFGLQLECFISICPDFVLMIFFLVFCVFVTSISSSEV